MTQTVTTLSNGLRVVTDSVETVHSVAIGIWADVGTRHEKPERNGVAHLVEHMVFKGTKNRSVTEIAEAIENKGGHINAYTGREITAFHIHLLKEDVNLAFDILSDMLLNPLFQDADLAREREVIIQEIGMYNDTPDDLIFEEFQKTAYPNQMLGASILGTPEIIRAVPASALFDHVNDFYTPSNLVVSVAGPVNHDEIVALCDKAFGHKPKGTKPAYDQANYKGGEIRSAKDLEQAHIVLGFRGINRLDPDYHAALVLSTIMGGGMSSRLFQEVREKRGLVYSVYSFHQAYKDDGMFAIYAGTGPDKLGELMPVLCDEVQKVTRTIHQAELDRAKAQIKASILMGREQMMSRADQQARQLITFDRTIQISETIEKIEELTTDNIKNVAKHIFTSVPTLASLGPVQNLASFEDIRSKVTI